MINVFAYDIQLALAQEEISEKKRESTTFRIMLQALFEKYPGLRLLTGDAGFTGRDLCREITRLGRHLPSSDQEQSRKRQGSSLTTF